MRRRTQVGIAGAAILLMLGVAAGRLVHGFTLVVRAADLRGPVRRLADLNVVPIGERIVSAPIGETSIRVRVYAPAGTARQTVLLVSGLHPGGIDEPRLVALSRRLAEANVTVVTPEILELSRFEITPVLTDRIEQTAVWLTGVAGLAPNGRIGLMGISFSGGLAVAAAGRASLRDRLLYVFSFGGHDDLQRVLEYFCTGIEAGTQSSGPVSDRSLTPPPPHDYGVAVVLLNVADRLVPPEQIAPLREAVRQFLRASSLHRVDRAEADREFAALRARARMLPEPSASLLGYVNDRDVERLGRLLLPHLGAYASAPALSPSRSPAPSAPVFLLHGRTDNVIPALESRYLADRLRGRVRVRLLLTDLISHADADRPAGLQDFLQLGVFWSDVLRR
jgi:dienelactone hydrolase